VVLALTGPLRRSTALGAFDRNARLRNCPGSLDFLSSRGFLLGCAAISGHA
jgi:hypothetical protein